MKRILYLCLVLSLGLSGAIRAQSLITYQLPNGLTVILDAKPSDGHINGTLAVNVGSADEEENATGVAHYLEHMLFKGTKELGTTNWEKEKLHYQKIVELYNDLQKATTSEEMATINKKINEESQKQAQYIVTNELSAAVQQMGGIGLNAYTSTDQTVYFNSFPANQIEKWLALYSHRFKEPVFRLFQTELETVYEEKNRSEDNPFMPYYNETQKILYGEEDPYARPIIGLTKHLKKPWMKGMIDFYEKWYVPENMLLILAGNFEVEPTKQLIEKYFGSIKAKPLAQRKYTEITVPHKKEDHKLKLTPYLLGSKNYLVSNKIELKESIALQLISSLLNNQEQTGMLDKLRIDGDVLSAGANFQERKRGGHLAISYAPKFDINQMRQESLKFTEKFVDESINKIKKGDYEPWLLESLKASISRQWEESMSMPSQRTAIYVDFFNQGRELKLISKFLEELNGIDKQYLTAVANKHLGDNCISIYSEKGEAKKEDQIEKPELDPIQSVTRAQSEYYKNWELIHPLKQKYSYFDPKDISISTFQDKVELHYLKNKQNNLFQMVIQFRAGEQKFPLLPYAVGLINSAGVMGQYEADELRKEFAKLNVNYSFTSDANNTYVVLNGSESKLGDACQLLSRLLLMPDIKEKALNGIIGREINNRSMEKGIMSVGQEALSNYLIYGKESPFIKRVSQDSVIAMAPSQLTAVINNVIAYQANIHYYGKLPENEVKNVLKNNLAFGDGRKIALPLSEREAVNYKKNTIYLVNEPKAKQSHIYFYINTENIPLEDMPKVKAFNQYFSGGFNGLVTKEIRENRAMAYSSDCRLRVPIKREWSAKMIGYIGTQSDKVVDAIKVMLEMLNNMPEYPERMNGITDYLKNSTEIESEIKNTYSLRVDNWKLMGYSINPSVEELPMIEKLSFKDVKYVFDTYIKEHNFAIGIFGNTKNLDVDQLKSMGTVKKLKKNKLFSAN